MWGALIRWTLFLAVLGGAIYWLVTQPDLVSEEAVAGLTPDAEAGAMVFAAAGCASCHAGKDATAEAKLILSGGQRFPSPFGTFVAPNISPDGTHGIGGWSEAEFASAVLNGVSPDGAHYFPAFPYASYTKMALQDVVDLHAYMKTLPADATPSAPHEVSFPFSIRRNLGGWKFLYLSKDWVAEAPTEQLERGRYLVEALTHCAECHTPRTLLGGLDTSQWMRGAPDPSGKGRVPGIAPDQLGWSEADIVEYLTTGFTPEFDTAGGHMVSVIENTALLPEADRQAIAAYVLALPAAP
jgi:mono/diheme cytochrome c family protein